MKDSPTRRSLAKLKQLGFQAAILERWNQWAKIRQDLWSFGDLIACRAGIGIMLIQTTSGDNHAKRREKIINEPRAATWLESGGKIEVWSWAKRGDRGCRKLWTLRREEITMADMVAATAPLTIAG